MHTISYIYTTSYIHTYIRSFKQVGPNCLDLTRNLSGSLSSRLLQLNYFSLRLVREICRLQIGLVSLARIRNTLCIYILHQYYTHYTIEQSIQFKICDHETMHHSDHPTCCLPLMTLHSINGYSDYFSASKIKQCCSRTSSVTGPECLEFTTRTWS